MYHQVVRDASGTPLCTALYANDVSGLKRAVRSSGARPVNRKARRTFISSRRARSRTRPTPTTRRRGRCRHLVRRGHAAVADQRLPAGAVGRVKTARSTKAWKFCLRDCMLSAFSMAFLVNLLAYPFVLGLLAIACTRGR